MRTNKRRNRRLASGSVWTLIFFLSLHAYAVNEENWGRGGSTCAVQPVFYTSQAALMAACDAWYEANNDFTNLYWASVAYTHSEAGFLSYSDHYDRIVFSTETGRRAGEYRFFAAYCIEGYQFDNASHQCIQDPCSPEETWNADPGQCELSPLDNLKNTGKPEYCPEGNPINQANGNKLDSHTDVAGVGPFPLSFTRYYNSDTAVVSSRLGAHWRGSYDRSLSFLANGVIDRYLADGKRYRFFEDNGVWQSDADVTERLEAAAGNTWRVTRNDDSVEVYDNSGKLLSISNRAGLTQTLEYALAPPLGDGNPGTLDRIVGPFQRSLRFSYDGSGRLAALTDPAGNIIQYGYDGNNNLHTVTYADGAVRTYHYENAGFPHALTGIDDETGQRYATYIYDSEGRATVSEHSGSVGRVEITYHADGSSTVTDSHGHTQVQRFEVMHGVYKLSEIEGGPCGSCGNSFQSVTYDVNGFVNSRTDFNGNTTTYIHNSLGLEISRTEALGTQAERTIQTTWHPDFRLPIRVVEPSRIVDMTYDTQGRLLSRKVSAP